MGTDATGTGSGSLFDGFRKEMTSLIDKGVGILESEQAKINRAVFEAFAMEQRDVYCQSLLRQGVKAPRIEKITGKSQPTVNRHLNGKHS